MAWGTAVNCIFWGNSGFNVQQVDQGGTVSVTYSIVQGGFPGVGNLNSDPQFVNPQTADFHLLATSPGINAGAPYILDVDGTRSDIGAYGGVVTSGPCSPHAAKAIGQVMNGFLVGATLTDPGCGYTSPPAVRITGVGTGAAATAVVSNGVITHLIVTSAGGGYTIAPTIAIASPPYTPWLETRVSKVMVRMHLNLGRKYSLERMNEDGIWEATLPDFTAEAEVLEQEFEVQGKAGFFRVREMR